MQTLKNSRHCSTEKLARFLNISTRYVELLLTGEASYIRDTIWFHVEPHLRSYIKPPKKKVSCSKDPETWNQLVKWLQTKATPLDRMRMLKSAELCGFKADPHHSQECENKQIAV